MFPRLGMSLNMSIGTCKGISIISFVFFSLFTIGAAIRAVIHIGLTLNNRFIIMHINLRSWRSTISSIVYSILLFTKDNTWVFLGLPIMLNNLVPHSLILVLGKESICWRHSKEFCCCLEWWNVFHWSNSMDLPYFDCTCIGNKQQYS